MIIDTFNNICYFRCTMSDVTVSPKYQIVIPKQVREKMKNLQPGAKASVYTKNEDTIIINISRAPWHQRTFGILKDAWAKVDPIKEVEKMRNDW